MPAFRYRTLQPSGAVVEGEIDARDEAAAVARLQDAGTYPLEIGPAGAAAKAVARAGTRLRGRELALFMRELATLVAAGVPADRALGVLAGLKRGSRAAQAAEELRTSLTAGERFSAACARHAAVPRLAAAMLAAGEAQGDLGAALDRVASHLERSRLVAQQVLSALLYPISVTVVGLLSTIFLLTFVVPRFEALLRDLNRELPPATRFLMDVSTALESGGPWVLLASVLLAALFYWRLRDPSFRAAVDRRLLGLPVGGELIRKIEAERFSRLLANLLGAGVLVPEALAIAGEAATNRAVAETAATAAAGVARGDRVAASLAGSGVLPELVIELTRVGEETGRLPDMLEKAADVLRQEIDVSVTRLIGLITPVSTILLGLLVGGLILAVFNAVLSAYDIGL
jgi:general secretion pathway protein F